MTKKKSPASRTESGGSTDATPQIKPSPIVVLGGSAGVLEAFTAFLNALPSATGMAYVLMNQVDPRHESLMAELLPRQTKLPVEMARNGIPVGPDHVYVIPPNRFLMSLAADQGRNAVSCWCRTRPRHSTTGCRAARLRRAPPIMSCRLHRWRGSFPTLPGMPWWPRVRQGRRSVSRGRAALLEKKPIHCPFC